MVEAAKVEIVGDNVQQLRHLAEYQHFVSLLLEFDQHLVEKHHFAANVDDLFRGFIHFAQRMIDQEGVIADAPQQHHHVSELRGG